ncbi:MAG TPA: hypothetical protein VG711_03425, partial [Phycisphaerales bacterium]|nr:hypothetical protein [Phycisphaerales bacterium]
LNVKKERGGAGAEAIAHVWSNAPQDVGRFVVIVDETVDVNDWQSVMFHLCANCDPLRDVHRMQGRLAFDATAKMHGDERNGMQVRQYPPIIKMSGEIKERVRKNMESMRSP